MDDGVQFIPPQWMQVRMEKTPGGPERARRFFNASPDATVEETEYGYRVEAAKCRAGVTNDWWEQD